MTKKVLIIGSGAMGSAMANVLVDNKINNTIIYGIIQTELDNLNNGKNIRYFPNIKLNKFKTTNNLIEALKNIDYLIFAIPSSVLKNVLNTIINHINHPTLIINVAKGFDLQTKTPIHQMIIDETKTSPLIRGVVSLIGPSHAEEIVQRKLTVINAVGTNQKLNQEVMAMFNNKYFKVKSELDVIGANVGAMYKNIIAIVVGMSDSLKMGVNTRAALMTYGLHEMTIFNKKMNGQAATIYGLNGLGDLIVTATSTLSRNYNFGYKYRQKNAKNENNTVEGIKACNIVYNLARTQNLKLPIVNILYKILFLNHPLTAKILTTIFI